MTKKNVNTVVQATLKRKVGKRQGNVIYVGVVGKAFKQNYNLND